MNYKGTDYTASATVANPDLIAGSGVVVLQYLQSVTSRLALGSELAYQKGPTFPGGEISVINAAAKYGFSKINLCILTFHILLYRYTTDTWQMSGTLGLTGVHLCYYQRASKQLQVGVELEANSRMQEAVASIGYQVDIPKSDVVFKGTFF